MCKCPNCSEKISGTVVDVLVSGHFDRAGVAFFVCPFCGDLLEARMKESDVEITISRKAGEWLI